MIPNTSLTIVPKNQYHQLIQLLDNIYQSWIIDQDEIRRNNFVFFFNIIKTEIEQLFKNNHFWIVYSMNSGYCMHINKKGEICNRRIDINCNEKEKYSKWKCYHHISKTIYSSKKRDSVDNSKKCIGTTKYGTQRRPCKNLKWNNMDYCKVHLKLSNPDMNTAYFNYFLNKLLWKDIMEEHKIYLDNISLEKEINLFNNINYDNNDIDFINIKHNKELCPEQNNNNNFFCSNYISDRKRKYYTTGIMNPSDSISKNFKSKNKINNSIYYYLHDRLSKKRKVNHKNNLLNYNFSFKYTITDYYINNIKKKLNIISNILLKYIIKLRNCIYRENYYKYNKTYMKILQISDKILEII